MAKDIYPDGSNEPDEEYNDFYRKNAEEDCSDDLDDAILNSSALTKNANKDNQYTYSNAAPIENKRKHLPFKEQWEQVDELCPTCNHVVKEAKGLTRQNMSRLLSFKGTYTGWIMFFLMAMALFFAYTSYSLMFAPALNCSNASALLVEQQNVNGFNQMPALNLDNLTLPTYKCQTENENASDYCSILNNTGYGDNESDLLLK